MAKKKQATNQPQDEVWFEIRLEKPLELEIGGELYKLFAGKNTTITNHVELVREAQRLGAEIRVVTDLAEDFLEDLVKQGRAIVKGIVKLTKKNDEKTDAKTEQQEPKETPKPPISNPNPQEQEQKPKADRKLNDIKQKLKVDISKLSPEEREKLKELLGE